MTILSLIKRIPSYADEVRVGISEAVNNPIKDISTVQFYGAALTAGYVLKHEQMLNDIRSEAKMFLQEAHSNACKTAAVIGAARSAYHTFRNTCESKDSNLKGIISDTAARFQENNVNVPEADFAIYCLTASVLLGCSLCTSHYIKFLTNKGIPMESLDKLMCFVCFLKAAAAALEIDSMRSYEFSLRGENLFNL